MNFLSFSRHVLLRRGIVQRNLLMRATKMQSIYFFSTEKKPKKKISLENIGEEDDDIGTTLKFDDKKAIPNVQDAEKDSIVKAQEKKKDEKPKSPLKQPKKTKTKESTSKPTKEETKKEISKELIKEIKEEQPSKPKKIKKWKDIRLGTLELTEENINPILKGLREIEEEEERKEKELMERIRIEGGMLKEEADKEGKGGEKGVKKEEEETSTPTPETETAAAPPLPISEKEKKKLAKLKKKAKAKGKKLPKKVDKEKEKEEKEKKRMKKEKEKEEEEMKKKKEKVKKQYTPIEYREVAGYQVPKNLTSRMIEKIYAQQLYRNNYTPLTKPVEEYINDKSISITDLPTVGLAFERIRRYAIGKNKDQPKRIWVHYFIKRCYEEGKAAYMMRLTRILTKNFFDFSRGMSSMILDTIGIYKSKDIIVDIMSDMTQYRLFPTPSYIDSLIIRYALDGNILMVNKLIFMYTHQYKYPENSQHSLYKVICFKRMMNYTVIWNYFRLNQDRLSSSTLEYIMRIANSQEKTDIVVDCKNAYEKRLAIEKWQKDKNPQIYEIEVINKRKKEIELDETN